LETPINKNKIKLRGVVILLIVKIRLILSLFILAINCFFG